MIVPLFALANAGIAIDRNLISDAFTAPIALGVLIGYVVGKPVGVVVGSLVATKSSRGRLRPPVGWGRSPAAARSRASASLSRC